MKMYVPFAAVLMVAGCAGSEFPDDFERQVRVWRYQPTFGPWRNNGSPITGKLGGVGNLHCLLDPMPDGRAMARFYYVDDVLMLPHEYSVPLVWESDDVLRGESADAAAAMRFQPGIQGGLLGDLSINFRFDGWESATVLNRPDIYGKCQRPRFGEQLFHAAIIPYQCCRFAADVAVLLAVEPIRVRLR